MDNFPISYLNSNDGSGLLAFGEGARFVMSEDMNLTDLQTFIDAHKGEYIFGFLSYDLKEKLHGLPSKNQDHLHFPDAFLWVPKHVVKLFNEHVEFIQGQKDLEAYEFLNNFLEEETNQNYHHYSSTFTPRISKEEYIQKVSKLKEHIQKGDIYEINFCQEFYTENIEIDYDLDTYFKLNNITKAPFSGYMQVDDFIVFCGSPERFLKKTGNKLISQPIKGTAPRGETPEEDEKLKEQLASDPKERSENVMIVDLVRNDLSRIAENDSVHVDELCEIYSFETVHQMMSTISGQLRPDVSFIEILKATFPMGSMTGAPKLRAMELIEEYESFKRGLYSGSVGYIAPNGDFDFNVVIRTLLYNKKEKYLSCSVGGAITNLSDPEAEFEECLVKVKRILDSLNG